MSIKPNTQELEQTARTVGLEIDIMDTESSDKYIKRVIETFKPFRSTGHLSIGGTAITLPLEGNEYSYSQHLNSEPAYVFFDQEGYDRGSVVMIKNAKLIGRLMENSFGMEYFVSNEKVNFLIAVNWYVIEVAGAAQKWFEAGIKQK